MTSDSGEGDNATMDLGTDGTGLETDRDERKVGQIRTSRQTRI